MNLAGGCPASEEIVGFVEGRIAASEGARLVDHAASCPACLRRIEVVRSIAAEAPQGEPFDLSPEDLEAMRRRAPAEVATRRARHPAWPRLAAAAAVAAAVVVGGFEIAGRLPPVLPGEGASRGSESKPRLLAPRPNEVLAEAPSSLEWRGPEGSRAFLVRVLASDSEPIFRARVAGTSVPLPREVRERLARGGSFFFEVLVVEGSPGSRDSEIAAFEVRPGR